MDLATSHIHKDVIIVDVPNIDGDTLLNFAWEVNDFRTNEIIEIIKLYSDEYQYE